MSFSIPAVSEPPNLPLNLNFWKLISGKHSDEILRFSEEEVLEIAAPLTFLRNFLLCFLTNTASKTSL